MKDHKPLAKDTSANRFYGITGRATSKIIIATYKVMEARTNKPPNIITGKKAKLKH